MLVTSPFFSFLTCLRRLTLWTMTFSLPDWIKHLQFAKRRCSGLEHIFQEEVRQYYLHPHAALNSSFNQAFHRALYWDQFSSPYMFQTLRVLLPPTVSPATSMQMTPRSTATAALRAFLILSVECRTCFREIVSWTSSNCLRLNPDKTEAIWFGSPAGCSRIGSPTLQLTGATIIPSQTVRSLGMYLDSSLTMGPHVGRVAAGCYAKLRVLKEAKPFVPHNIFISLIVQLILSKLDYCNSLLVNASCRNLNTLQAAMNTAARLIYYLW